jgi:hypothetical protein
MQQVPRFQLFSHLAEHIGMRIVFSLAGPIPCSCVRALVRVCVRARACVFVCARARACVCVRARVCESVRVRACVRVHACM